MPYNLARLAAASLIETESAVFGTRLRASSLFYLPILTFDKIFIYIIWLWSEFKKRILCLKDTFVPLINVQIFKKQMLQGTNTDLLTH